MLVNDNGVETLYYGYSDNQGSLIALTDENGTVVEKYAYDPWGARRNPTDWRLKDTRVSFITNRGYTGHEHLDAFGIINMNGRVYDPHTAMFFSPDPFVQTPDNWLNYNRYGYCLNNPTKYTDPTGYQFMYIEMPVFSEYASHWMEFGTSGGNFDWTHRDRGSIHYDYNDKKYKYANGDEATFEDAMDMYGKRKDAHKMTQSFINDLRNNNKAKTTGAYISTDKAVSSLPNALGIMVSLSQEFVKINPDKFALAAMNGTEIMMTTDQLIMGLEVASLGTFILGIGVEGGIAVWGEGETQQDAKQNFWSDSMVSLSIYTISAAGCGVPALILGVGWVLYRTGAFKGMEIPTPQYHQNNYHPNSMPQDAIRPQYPLKDGPQPIYFHY